MTGTGGAGTVRHVTGLGDVRQTFPEDPVDDVNVCDMFNATRELLVGSLNDVGRYLNEYVDLARRADAVVAADRAPSDVIEELLVARSVGDSTMMVAIATWKSMRDMIETVAQTQPQHANVHDPDTVAWAEGALPTMCTAGESIAGLLVELPDMVAGLSQALTDAEIF